MPMSKDFKSHLNPNLKKIAGYFGTPFHIYDEKGILETGENLKKIFAGFYGFKEFFAVKALPNPRILEIMKSMGFGFDVSSIPEIKMVRAIGSVGEDIMFSSNNTSPEEFNEAIKNGCIINIDDLSLIKKLPQMPKLVCFRYNPGPRRTGNSIIGKPEESKYGIPDKDIVKAYRLAKEHGAERFGLHTMICSNQLDYKYMAETVKMLLEVLERVSGELDIKFEFINIGGGIGIPYKSSEKPFNISSLAKESKKMLSQFEKKCGYQPKFFMELGRYMTGPHGVLVTTVLNRMHKYHEYVGVDACMSDLMRPAIYGTYHHITVLGKESASVGEETVDVSGSLCENNDKFAIQRRLPKITEGDILLIHDTGAHGLAMGFNYNGRLRPKELLLKEDDSIELIRREETYKDYTATFDFEPKILKL